MKRAHALAALAAGFQLREMAIGPLILSRRHSGWRLAFDWRRLLQGGGYVGATPRSDRLIRLKEIFIVVCGPLTSLIGAVSLIWAFPHLRGTTAEPYWHIVSLTALLGIHDFALNLLPFGYTDGSMLFHLLFRTRRGEELLARILRSQVNGGSGMAQPDQLESRRKDLQSLLEQNPNDRSGIAHAYAALGRAELQADGAAAEASFHKCLETIASGPPNRPLEADCWKALHRAYLLQRRSQQARQAYMTARRIFETLREYASVDAATLHGSLAELHIIAGEHRLALAEIDAALVEVTTPRAGMLVASLFRFRAECNFELGELDRGLAAAEQAAALFRTAYLNDSERMLALRQLGLLAIAYSGVGKMDHATELLTECVRLFETHGATYESAYWRLVLSEVLTAQGFYGRALCVQPVPDRTPPALRVSVLQDRGELLLKAGRLEYAIADFEEMLRRAETENPPNQIRRATAQSLLSQATLETGNLERAGRLAEEAYATLSAAGHPDRARAAITLAIVRHSQGEPASAYAQDALRAISESTLNQFLKALRFETAAARLENGALMEEAKAFYGAAGELRDRLGIHGAVAATAAL